MRAAVACETNLVQDGGTSTEVTEVAGKLTLPIGVAFGRDGALYVLEFADGYLLRDDRFAPASGRLLRAATTDDARRGNWHVIAQRLDFPTAVATGPDGALYVSVAGAYRGRGQGRILRFQQPP